MVTQGLASLTSVNTNELVLFEMTGDEWNNYSDKNLSKGRISIQLNRDDLRPVRFLRGEDTFSARDGISFQEFRKIYKPHAAIYECPICETGEAVSLQKQTIEEYQNNGGSIICLDGLQIRKV